jgi:hypothetical protein
MAHHFKRINIQIREDQHRKITDQKLSITGLVRDLLDDHFSENKIVLNVTQLSKEFYDKIISNFGGTDEEIEKYFMRSLELYLKDKLARGEALRQEIMENLE